MAILTTALVLPSELKPSFSQHQISRFVSRRRPRKSHPAFPVCVSFFSLWFWIVFKGSVYCFLLWSWWVWLNQVARLFGPAIFEASKLEVLFLGVDEKKHQGKLPRIYTLTHSDMTSKLTLAISQTINNSQVLSILACGVWILFLLFVYESIWMYEWIQKQRKTGLTERP